MVSEWGFLQWAGFVLGSLLYTYVGTRLVSAAYFMSKRDHDGKER
jgi:hypothetical protein